MRCFTWAWDKVVSGLGLTSDEKLGPVVFLGEAGRGRRYEKVAMSKRNPPKTENNQVLEAKATKIVLPPRDGKPELAFFVLEADTSGDTRVLVRINSHGCYTKHSRGGWRTESGSPEVIVEGHGARGDAGRIGGWRDGLLVMSKGDCLRVTPEGGHKVESYALYISEDGNPKTCTWRDYENLQAVAKAEALVAEAAAKPASLKLLFGRMPTYTYSGQGKTEPGIDVRVGATGKVVALGEDGRGREYVEVPIVGFAPEGRLDTTSVAVLHEEPLPRSMYDSGPPKIKKIFGLVESENSEEGALLVRMRLPHSCRTFGDVEALKGEPTRVAKGMRAGGDAGRADRAEDSLWVLKPGDVLKVDESGRYGFAEVITNDAGTLKMGSWLKWEIADANANPAAYIVKGKAPATHIPTEWVGRVVEVEAWDKEYDSRERKDFFYLRPKHEGEIVSLNPLVLNLGWDGRDRKEVTVPDAVWVKLDPYKQVKRIEGSAAEDRAANLAKAEALREEAKAIVAAAHFECYPNELKGSIRGTATGLDNWGGERPEFGQMTSEELCRWVEWAQGVVAEAAAHKAAAEETLREKESGNVLLEFSAYTDHRYNQGKVWVVRSDGSLREPDATESDGRRYRTLKWRMLRDEVVLVHNLVGAGPEVKTGIAWRPKAVTQAQIETTERIETENSLQGTFEVDPSLVAKRAAMMEGIRKEILRVAPDHWEPEKIRFLDVSGENGIQLRHEATHDLVNHAMPFGASCMGREAQVVKSVRCAGGVLEFLAYQKWGTMNLNARWRALAETETSAPVAAPAPTVMAKAPADKQEPSEDALLALKRKLEGRE